MMLGISGLASGQPVVEAWSDLYPGFNSVGVVTSADGFVYVAGRSDLTPENGFRSDIVTIKYDLDGNRVWVREFDETGDGLNGTDQPSWLTLDPFGNVLVTGVSFIDGSAEDVVTLKYDLDGNLLWVARSIDARTVSRVATDSAGNVYVAGITSASDSLADFVVVKYDPDGNELWTTIDPGGFGDSVHGLEVTADGEAIVVGESSNGASCFDTTTLFYEPDGSLRWKRSFSAPVSCSLDEGSDVALGLEGEIYVAGHADNGNDIDFLLIRYDELGNEVWVRTPEWSGSQLASRVRVDSRGDVVLAGTSQSDFAVLKYAPEGDRLWAEAVDVFGEDVPFDMTVGPGDAIYVTGYSTVGSNAVGTVRLDANGSVAWTVLWDEPVFSDIGWGVQVDAAGDVVVSGQGESSILTVRYLQEQGPRDPLAVALTPVGDPIVVLPGGGEFEYDVRVENLTDRTRSVDLWITIAGEGVEVVLGPVSRELDGGSVFERRLTQAVPGLLPPGVYTQTLSAGSFPAADASDSFDWTKE